MFIDAMGTRVHTVSFGAGERIVVGIAGSFGTWEMWQQPFELLSGRYRVIAYDHLGAGLTDAPDGLVSFESQVDCLFAVLDHYGVDRCVLAGDSNMVTVAIEAALREPDRFDGLALVAGGVVHEPDERVTAFVAGLRQDFDRTLDGFVAVCVPEPDAEHIRGWLQAIIRRTGAERAAKMVESFYGVDLSSRLPELGVPTTVIQGDHDALPASNAEAARRMAETIPQCRFVLLEGAGHVPTLTRPVDVARELELLFERPSPRDS